MRGGAGGGGGGLLRRWGGGRWGGGGWQGTFFSVTGFTTQSVHVGIQCLLGHHRNYVGTPWFVVMEYGQSKPRYGRFDAHRQGRL